MRNDNVYYVADRYLRRFKFRLGVVVTSTLIFALVFPFVYREAGANVGALLTALVLISSILLGVKGGLVIWALSVPLYAIEVTILDHDGLAETLQSWPGIVGTLLLTFVVGSVRNLVSTLQRHYESSVRLNEERLRKINGCFLSFGADPVLNIRLLIDFAGELLGSRCVLYNRYDHGRFVPLAFIDGKETEIAADGALCHSIIESAEDDGAVIRGLQQPLDGGRLSGQLADRFHILMGKKIRIDQEFIGSLCVLFESDKEPGTSQKELLGILASAIAIEEKRKRSEDKLEESTERYRTVVSNAPVISFVTNARGIFTLSEGRGLAKLGLQPGEVVGLSAFDVYRDFPSIVDSMNLALAGQSVRDEVRINDTVFDVSYSSVVDHNGAVVKMIGVATDITERKRSEEVLKEALMEKVVLLKEIHHRVKNNLQVISSMLNLQSGEIDDPKMKEIFNESKNRVRSMALIHEKMYQSENLSKINFDEYVRSMVAPLVRAHGHGNVSCAIEVTDVVLSIDHAVPCGLIINELVSNALKHAFPMNRKGEIRITMASLSAADIVLSIEDDGIGFPEGVDFKTMPSMGMGIVLSLTDQLGGTIVLERGAGTRFRLQFPYR